MPNLINFFKFFYKLTQLEEIASQYRAHKQRHSDTLNSPCNWDLYQTKHLIYLNSSNITNKTQLILCIFVYFLIYSFVLFCIVSF
jgi:hypothetical protein